MWFACFFSIILSGSCNTVSNYRSSFSNLSSHLNYAANTQAFTPAETDYVVTNPISGPSPIMSTVRKSPSSYQFVHPQGQVNSFFEGWEKVASSLERCMNKLTKANLKQSAVSKELFVSGQLPKLTISVFESYPSNILCVRVLLML